MDKQKIIAALKTGQLAVIPTDTQYGLVTSALNQQSVEKVYKLRKRSPEKPCIILISSIEDLKLFEIAVNKITTDYLSNIWPNPVSIVLPCLNNDFSYLHRGTNSLAFRIPDNRELLEILKDTGPLIAPSANIEGLPFAKTINDAKKYFGGQVDFYIDQGELESVPSTIIKIESGKVVILRQGEFKIDKLPKNLS